MKYIKEYEIEDIPVEIVDYMVENNRTLVITKDLSRWEGDDQWSIFLNIEDEDGFGDDSALLNDCQCSIIFVTTDYLFFEEIHKFYVNTLREQYPKLQIELRDN